MQAVNKYDVRAELTKELQESAAAFSMKTLTGIFAITAAASNGADKVLVDLALDGLALRANMLDEYAAEQRKAENKPDADDVAAAAKYAAEQLADCSFADTHDLLSTFNEWLLEQVTYADGANWDEMIGMLSAAGYRLTVACGRWYVVPLAWRRPQPEKVTAWAESFSQASWSSRQRAVASLNRWLGDDGPVQHNIDLALTYAGPWRLEQGTHSKQYYLVNAG